MCIWSKRKKLFVLNQGFISKCLVTTRTLVFSGKSGFKLVLKLKLKRHFMFQINLDFKLVFGLKHWFYAVATCEI